MAAESGWIDITGKSPVNLVDQFFNAFFFQT
jgi:hypothetical protein